MQFLAILRISSNAEAKHFCFSFRIRIPNSTFFVHKKTTNVVVTEQIPLYFDDLSPLLPLLVYYPVNLVGSERKFVNT